jgi:poly(beta-D-mannuronate) lyase
MFNNWKLTLPLGNKGFPIEVKEDIHEVTNDCFYFTADGYVMIAPCDGITTKNSSYPRCELREMTEWVLGEGVHTLEVSMKIMSTPKVKPQIVIAQIHDKNEDILMIRATKGKSIDLVWKGKHLADLIDSWKFGYTYNIKVYCKDKKIDVSINEKVFTKEFKKVKKGCYFKAGVYTQSNVDKGDEPYAKGAVVLEHLRKDHDIPKKCMCKS